jgi:hypothetical protein
MGVSHEARQSDLSIYDQNFERANSVALRYAQDPETIKTIAIESQPLTFGDPTEYDQPALVVSCGWLATYIPDSNYREHVAVASFGLTRSHYLGSVTELETDWRDDIRIHGTVDYKSVSEMDETLVADRAVVLTREHDPHGNIKRIDAQARIAEYPDLTIPGMKRVTRMLEQVKAPTKTHSIVEVSRSQSRADFAAITDFINHVGIGKVVVSNAVAIDVIHGAHKSLELVELQQERFVYEDQGHPSTMSPGEDDDRPTMSLSIIGGNDGEVYCQEETVDRQRVAQINNPERTKAYLDGFERSLMSHLVDTEDMRNTNLTQRDIRGLLDKFNLVTVLNAA